MSHYMHHHHASHGAATLSDITQAAVNQAGVAAGGYCPTVAAAAAAAPSSYVPSSSSCAAAVPIDGPSPAVAVAQATTHDTVEMSPHRRFARLPEYCAEYHQEIIDYFLDREITQPRDYNYLARQTDITEKMRVILVDWMVDVIIKFKLHPETFYLACDIVDRYLMTTPVLRSTLQLVGITAVLIAAKHEEIWPPEVKECVYISANTYTRDDILRMERDIAGALQFRFAVPTVYPILCQMLDASGASLVEAHLSHYFLETAALDYQLLRFPPSRVAYSACFLAKVTMAAHEWEMSGVAPLNGAALVARVWPATVMRASRHCDVFNDILPCATALLSFTRQLLATKYLAVKRKYSHQQFGEVSTIFPLPDQLW